MYDAKRSYIYNKAFFEKFVNKNLKQAKVNAKEAADKALEHIEAMKAELISHSRAIGSNETYQDLENKKSTTVFSRFQNIRDWAEERRIYEKREAKTQYVKLMEEAGEVGRAILKDDDDEIQDGIGDMVVVLTNLAELSGLTIEECIESAYDTIAKRKGKMINGTFVKNN